MFSPSLLGSFVDLATINGQKKKKSVILRYAEH